MDYADNTLWADNQGTLYQYDRNGTLLSQFSDAIGLNTLGAEFAVASQSVPEPGAALLLGTGILVLGVSRRRSATR
jgi:hypothetical protein